MEEIKAGVTLMQDFCRPESNEFGEYVDYLDGEHANKAGITTYDLYNYNDYMGNPEKSSGLFTFATDEVSYSDKKEIKELFETAQVNGSLMWQTVISFDNRWLENNGIYDREKNFLDERKIKEVVRLGVNRMLEKEGLEFAVWTGGIHYNTDNIHVHIATVEPDPTRTKMVFQGKEEYRGKFKQKSLELCKSSIVNAIVMSKEINLKINHIIRQEIVAAKKERMLANDPEIRGDFLKLYESLQSVPSNMQNYNNSIMRSQRDTIDKISEKYIEKYHKEEYGNLMEILEKQGRMYHQAYGGTMKHEYAVTKQEELFERLGNAVLKEVRIFSKSIESEVLNEETEKERVLKLAPKEMEKGRVLKLVLEEMETEKVLKLAPKEMEKGKVLKLAPKAKFSFDKEKNIERNLVEEKRQPNDMSEYQLGIMLLKGAGCEKNLEEGISYLEKSMKQGNQYAKYQLGREYLNNKSPVYNAEVGMEYILELGKEGFEYAQVKLGVEYLKGENVRRNLNQSKEWFAKAADQGNKFAENMLDNITEQPSGHRRRRGAGELDKALYSLKRSMQEEYFNTVKNIREYEYDLKHAHHISEVEL